ncbi:NAD(P)H-hydrate dehydratase [Plantibacter flavus]|uniref:ADP-dependent NAD(P)H-hydrate dehydratase n=1 Tax=Plantibacter flavus TaxID=150123 RepID=UPI003F171BFE
MADAQHWTADDTRAWIVEPGPDSDKYSRGVLGVVTGSEHYPGAAVVGVEAAVRTGLGMVRYLGSERPAQLVLQRRPEIVTVPGRVQAWLIGSGMDPGKLTRDESALLDGALRGAEPVVADAGALRRVTAGAHQRSFGVAESLRIVATPHAGELGTMLSGLGSAADLDAIRAEPVRHAADVASRLGVVVVLKGSTTHVVSPDGVAITVSGGSPWLATAGSGDALAGVIGALIATNAERVLADPSCLPEIAASGVFIHAAAGDAAAADGPVAALDVSEAVRGVVGRLLG